MPIIDTLERYEICSKLIIKTPEWRQWRHAGVVIVNFWVYFKPFSSVSVVNFDQVNVCEVNPKCFSLNLFSRLQPESLTKD